MPLLRRLRPALPLVLLAGAACAGESGDAAAAVPVAEASSAAADAPLDAVGMGAPAGVAVAPAVVAVPDSADRAAAAAATDTVKRDADSTARINVRVRQGRTKRDSLALVRTVRMGQDVAADWPTGPTPAPGAILPRKRIIAYYGNPLSKRMGVLGEYETDEMLRRLDKEVAAWNKADPSTPVQPALHLVAMTAQGAPGADGMYNLKMSDELIEKVYGWARQHNAIMFIDLQVGMSTLQKELPRFEKFLTRPDMHLGIDPEFAMKTKGVAPGKKIGTLDAADINYVSRYLSDLTKKHNLPPKVLVVHRFTRGMVTNSEKIRLDPNVQVVMHMDGWGGPWLKYDSYRDYILKEPVQYTGFKLFYHNDTKKGDALVTPTELVQLKPAPLYIQYQ